uniref:Uncharacterized protein n=1 Tax=Arundo donax TaxID=35708 RepID=A0A0A9H8B5_ARUDO
MAASALCCSGLILQLPRCNPSFGELPSVENNSTGKDYFPWDAETDQDVEYVSVPSLEELLLIESPKMEDVLALIRRNWLLTCGY